MPNGTETVTDYIRKISKPQTAVSIKLDEKRINYILLYHGSFNPPHADHLGLLRDAVSHIGNDINLACAIVVPRSEQFLRDVKFKETDNPLVLPHTVRSKLLSSDERWPDYAVVLDEEVSTNEVLEGLRRYASQAGLRIQYIALVGAGENLKRKWEYLCPSECVDMVLMSTYGRQGSGNLASWAITTGDWQALHRLGDSMERYQTTLRTKRAVTNGFVRVIRAREPYVSSLSSTSIRQAAREADMSGIALSWDLLQSDPTWSKWRDGQTLQAEDT